MKKIISIISAAVLLTLSCFAESGKTVNQYYSANRTVLESYEEMLAIAQSGYKVSGKHYTISDDTGETGLDIDKIKNPDGYGGDISAAVKFIFAALASGKTPDEFANYDVVKYLSEAQQADGSFSTYVYSHCTAMLALYAVKADFDEDKAISSLLSSQFADGAWGYNDYKTGDPVDDADTTAVAITVLAGKDGNEAKNAVTSAVAYLKTAMQPDGGFITYGEDSSSTAACVLLALVDAGVDIDNSEFSKILTKLEKFKNSDGSYRAYLDDADEFDRFSTSQIFLALEAYKNGKSVYKLLSDGGAFSFSLENVAESSSSADSNSSSSTPNTEKSIPATGDIMIIFVIVLIFSGAACVFITINNKKKK